MSNDNIDRSVYSPTTENPERDKFVEEKLASMTIAQKIGQTLVMGFAGTTISPEIKRRIREYQPAGLATCVKWRVRTVVHDPDGTNPEYGATRMLRTLKGTNRDYVPFIPVPYCQDSEFCEVMNELKKASLENETGIPLCITGEDEGDQSSEYFYNGYKLVPTWKGIAETGDPKIAHDVTWAISRQILPLGFDWTFSLCVDVNSEHMNPEIGTRSFGDNHETVCDFAEQALYGYLDGGMMCCAKHFPGRGHCALDAHRALPTIDESKERMYDVHLAPYRRLIEAGVPSIMTAHSKYPALDPSGTPATLSKTILTDILKGEMGFKGVILTDEITMGGIIAEYDVPEACIMAIEAGADQILFRDEGGVVDEAFPAMVDAVKSGRITEERLDDAVRRTLVFKYNFGFFNENKTIRDESKASEGIQDPKVEIIADNASLKSLKVIRDENNLMPLAKDTKVMLIEQINPLHALINDMQHHPGMLWEECLKHSDNVGFVETTIKYDDEDRRRVELRKDQADIFIVTNYFNRRVGAGGGNSFVEEIHKWGKPVIVVTNSPYPLTVRPEYKTVICNYSSNPKSYAEVANIIFGKK